MSTSVLNVRGASLGGIKHTSNCCHQKTKMFCRLQLQKGIPHSLVRMVAQYAN